MKVTNIVLSIIILLLAIVLALASFFLFEKRETMTHGWEKLTGTINKTAAEMDKKSGTDLASALNQDALHHTNYAQLDDKLKALNEGAAALIRQRDNLANTLVTISRLVEAANIPDEEALTRIATSENVSKDVVKQAQTFKDRRDAVLNALVRSGRLIGVNVNVNDLKNGNSAKVFNAFDAKLKELNTQLASYQDFSRKIASLTGASTPNFNVNAYRASLANIENSVKALRDKYNSTNNSLNDANRKINSLNNTVQQKNTQIANLNRTITAKNDDIKELKRIIGVDENSNPRAWRNGSREARSAVKGKVLEINSKFGFYVVDFGNNTRVEQKIGKQIYYANPQIGEGMSLTIARNMDSPDVKFIAKGKITNVADDCSIIEVTDANIPVQVGDDVYFASGDLK